MPSALNYSKQGLLASQFQMMLKTSFSPCMCPIQCLSLIVNLFCGRCAFIKSKNNIGTNIVLDLHGFFRSKIVGRAVQVRPEHDAVPIYFNEFWLDWNILVNASLRQQKLFILTRHFTNTFSICCTQRKNLKATRVSHCWTSPIHKFSKPSGFLHQFIAWLEIQVVSIRQNNLRAQVFYRIRREAFDRSFGADRDKNRR